MKNRAAQRYNILIVPDGKSSIKKLEVGRPLFAILVIAAVALMGFFAASIAGFVHYRNAYLATEKVRLEAADFERNSAYFASKLAYLEGAIGQTSRFAAKVQTLFNQGANVQSGEGPIDEEDWLPSVEGRQGLQGLKGKMWSSPFNEVFTAKLGLKLDEMATEAAGAEEKLNSVFGLQQDRLFFWASLPSIWPTHGWVTSIFGDRRSLHRSTGYAARWHEGIDIAGPYGTPVMVSGDGLVTFVGYRSGYGKMLVVDHGNGILSIYAHCSSIFVDEGSRVARGMVVAAIGNTGRSTGPHLHYEIHVDGVPVNPLNYIVDNM